MHARPEARFPALYETHFGFVLGVVRALGVSPRDQEDVVQEVWVKAYRKIDRLRGDASERAWLASFARRTVQHYRRRAGRSARKIQAVSHHREDVTNPHLRFEKRQLADAVLAQLNSDQRVAYVLVHGYGMSGAEAAKALGASVNTIYSRLRLAQKNIDRLCESTGVPTEALAAGAQTEPEIDPDRRARVLALVMLQVRGAEAAVLGTWLAFALEAAVLAVVAAGLTLDAPADGRPVAVTRSSVAPTYSTVRAAQADGDLIVAPALPLRAGNKEQPVTPVAPSPLPTESEQPDPPAPTSSHRRPARRSIATTTEPPAAAQGDESGIRETPGEGTPPQEAESIVRSDQPTISDAQLAALATEVASASAARSAAWGAAVAAAPPTPKRASIAPETKILRDAKAAHNAGHSRDALRMLKEYEDNFPRGRLRDVATGIRVSALCERGRTRAAKKQAAALQQRSPSSPINAKVRHACW